MATGISPLQRMLAGLSPRERKLMLGLGITFVILLLGGMYWWSASALDDIESERASAVDALRVIRNESSHIRDRRRRRDQMLERYRTRAPALTSFVESAAREANVTVSEATDRNPTNDGRSFQRRAVNIRLRRVDLQSLVNFMSRIDSAPFPVAITSIRIRRRFGEANAYDVDDMVISTWDRTATAAADRRTTTGSAGAAPTTGRADERSRELR